MFIWKSTKLRGPAYPLTTPYVDAAGTKYTYTPMELLEEIDCPVQRMPDETHCNQEIDPYPYLTVAPKSPEQLARLQASKDLASATAHLTSTDYLFAVDRHSHLLVEEPQREVDLRASREAARAVIRQYKLDYPDVR
jgi:hypothetical protein